MMRWLVIALLLTSTKAFALSETDCLAYTLFKEARGESLRGKRAILDTIYNRMHIRGLSACAVMKQHKQFSWYRKGLKIKMDIEALTDFLKVDKMHRVLANDVEYFHVKGLKRSWTKGLTKVAVIGNHTFFADRRIKQNRRK